MPGTPELRQSGVSGFGSRKKTANCESIEERRKSAPNPEIANCRRPTRDCR
jgi:hypothetical protein